MLTNEACCALCAKLGFSGEFKKLVLRKLGTPSVANATAPSAEGASVRCTLSRSHIVQMVRYYKVL